MIVLFYFNILFCFYNILFCITSHLSLFLTEGKHIDLANKERTGQAQRAQGDCEKAAPASCSIFLRHRQKTVSQDTFLRVPKYPCKGERIKSVTKFHLPHEHYIYCQSGPHSHRYRPPLCSALDKLRRNSSCSEESEFPVRLT